MSPIAVNLLWCVPGDVGGSEEYLVRQLLGLLDEAPDLAERCVLYVVDGFTAAHPQLAERYQTVVADFDGSSRLRRIVGETRWLRQASAGAALVHHGGGTAPLTARQPYVLTIHDLQYRDLPQNFTATKRAYLALMMRRSAKHAERIATPTEFVKGTVIEAFGVDASRIDVVPHGIEAEREVTPAADLRDRYALGDGPIVVYPAVTNPHKNHLLLVELLNGPWADRDVTVVCCGQAAAAESVLHGAPAGRLRRLPRVPAADRNGLVAMAEALVFPSLYEGFGAPLIEAMTLGTPIVSSNAASIPEVVGGAGVVRPPTVEAWADALDEVDRRRDELIAAGYRRAEQFTAAHSGKALAKTYRQAES